MPPQRNYPMWSGAFWNSKERERRDNAAADADLKRQMILDEFIAGIANKAAMERLDKQEAGDTAREKMRLDRQDIWHLRDAGVSNDNARMMAEQRAAEDEAERAWRAQAAKDELARRRAADAMDWWDNSAKIQIDRKKAEADILDQEARRPFEELKSRAAAINAINIAKEAGLDVEDELMQKAGLKIGQPGSALSKPTRREFQSRVVKPTVTVDYGAQNVTNSATNVPMPPDANGQRKSSSAGAEYSNVMGGTDLRNFIEALSDKSLKPR